MDKDSAPQQLRMVPRTGYQKSPIQGARSLLRIALESFLIAGWRNAPAMINQESTNENNTDVDRWVDARSLRINGKPCTQSYSCTGSAIRIRRCCGGGHNMRLPLTIKPMALPQPTAPLHRSHWNRIYRGIGAKVAPKVAPMSSAISTHVYGVRRRKDKRGVNLISDVLSVTLMEK